MGRPRRTARAAVLVLALAVAACGGQSRPAEESRAPSPSTSPSGPVSALEQRCGTPVPPGVPVRALNLPSADGVRLAAAELGSGPRGVVLLHQTDRPAMCGWVPYAGYLATRGMHVLLLDMRCAGESTCPTDLARATNVLADTAVAVSTLRRLGATTVALLGASRGGAVAITAAARLPGIARAVALSPALFDVDYGGGATTTNSIPRLKAPLLYAVEPEDSDSDVAQGRALVARAPAGRVTFTLLPTYAGHGWDTVRSFGGAEKWSPFAADVHAFLTASG